LVYCWFTVGLLLVYCWFTVGLLLVYCWFTVGLLWFTLGSLFKKVCVQKSDLCNRMQPDIIIPGEQKKALFDVLPFTM